MRSILFLTVAIATLCASRHAFAQNERIVYSGVPLLAATADGTTAGIDSVAGVNRNTYRLRIVLRGGKYYWASRGDRELRRSESGKCLIFACDAGIIKLINPVLDAVRAPLLKSGEEKFDYVEILHQHLATLTYWGRGSGDSSALNGK